MERVNLKDLHLTYDAGNLQTRRATDMIVLHHTGNPTDDDLSAEEINASHQAQGWTCIGYHYVVRKDGTIEVGRPHWTIGAHAAGENSHTIGIHVCGNFEIGYPTAAQIEAMAMAVTALADGLWLTIDKARILTHGEAADNEDGVHAHAPYGPRTTCERWDLEYLGTAESPAFHPWAEDGTRGGDVLRGKTQWYRERGC